MRGIARRLYRVAKAVAFGYPVVASTKTQADAFRAVYDALDLQKLTGYLEVLGARLEADGLAAQGRAAQLLARHLAGNPFNVIPLCRLGEELRAAGRMADYHEMIKSLNLTMFMPSRHAYLHDFTDFERETYFEVFDKCAQMPESIASTMRFVEYVIRNNIPGDFVECGVWLGASPYVIAKALLRLGATDRRIYMYDTYEGFPYGEPIDVPYSPDGNYAQLLEATKEFRRVGGGDRFSGSTEMKAPIETTRANVEASGYPKDKLIFVKGLVEDTIPGAVPATAPEQISILRLDTDHYRSTRHELDHFYPRLSRGGLLIIDDYGYYLGSKQATDEYFAEKKIPACLFRIDEHVRAFIKP
jgi:O-methyltransferase